jgi:alpha-beta hydrolase superfamily lysophospholipase
MHDHDEARTARVARALLLTILALVSSPATATASGVVEGDLPRQADLGFAFSGDAGTLVVANLVADSAAARAGLAKGDLIVAIDGQRFAKPYHGEALLVRHDGERPLTLEIHRGDEAAPRTLRFTPPARALEDLAGVDSHYGVVTTPDGARLRTIVTRPQRTTGRLPVIFFTQWVSCGTVEFTRGGLSREILKVLARESGAALVRVERAGAGDSEGPACHELDYDTEVAHYRAALDAVLGRYAWLDPGRLVIYGSSLGSTIAPLVAQGRPVAGLIVQGGGAISYLERMIAFDRQQLERTGVPVGEIHARMQRQIAFHVEYLVRGRDPEAIARDDAGMASARSAIRGLGDGEHYGRPYAWHQQAAQRNFAAAWAAIDAPVLAIFGEFDQFESRHGHEWIADIVNARAPGRATFLAVPRMDHEGDVYDTIEDAYAWERPISGEPAQAHLLQTGPMLRWLHALPGFGTAR